MIQYFFLAMVAGIVLKWVARFGISYCLGKAPNDVALKRMPLFHIGVVSYVLGVILHVGAITVGLAWCVKELL